MSSFLKKMQGYMLYLLPVFLVLAIIDYRFHSYFWPRFNVLGFIGVGNFFDFVSIFTVFLILFLSVSFLNRFKPNKFLLFALGAVLIGGLVSVFANDLYEPILRLPGLYLIQVYFLPILLCIVLVNKFEVEDSKLKFEYILVCCFAVLALFTVIQYFLNIMPGSSQDFMGRAVWPYIDPFSEMKPESANWLSFIYAPLALLGLLRVKKGKIWMMLPTLVLLVALLLSESYGGILTLLMLSFVYLFFNVSKKSRLGLIALGLLSVIVLVLTQYSTPKFQALIGNYHMPNSLERREQIYQFNWQSLGDDFLTGVGPGNYQSNFRENQSNYLSETIPELELPPHPHNLIFNFWSDLGLFGLILAIGIYLLVAANLIKGNWSFLLIAYPLVHGLIDTPYILEEVTMMFWILLALSIAGAKKRVLAK